MHDEVSRPAAGQAPANDELLRLVFESARDCAIFSMDPQGLVTSWNPGAERLLGYAPDEVLGRTADLTFTPEDRAAAVPEQERRDALRVGRAEEERWQVRKDGSRFWSSGLTMPLADLRLGFLKILRDHTRHYLANERLRKAEERFRLLATNIPQLVFRARAGGYRTWPSPQWIAFTGLGSAESEGFGWLEAIHPEDRERTRAAWAEAVETGEYLVEHRVRAASGEYHWHRSHARPIAGPPAEAELDWVGIMTDIHDLRTLHDRQEVLMAELQHRTRNLLAVTQAIATQTLRKSRTLQDFQIEFESRLRALSRVQMLMSGVDYTDVDLGELLKGELGAHDSGVEGERVHVDGPPVVLPTAAAQAMGLALHELATNAAKYGALAQSGGRLDVTWRVAARETGRTLELDWRESGVAMPAAEDRRRYGYGSELIERALPYQLGARTYLDFGADGVHCRIAVLLGPAERTP